LGSQLFCAGEKSKNDPTTEKKGALLGRFFFNNNIVEVNAGYLTVNQTSEIIRLIVLPEGGAPKPILKSMAGVSSFGSA
jgi:hypothetical protein